MNRKDEQAFPQQNICWPGGLSKREYVAIEALKAILNNPEEIQGIVFQGATIYDAAISHADKFFAALAEKENSERSEK